MMPTMKSKETLPEELRRGSYVFVLSIYDILERLPGESVLVKDIESHANWFLTLAARYPVSQNKGQTLKDIIGELKGIRALLGVLRDSNVLERQPARSLLEKCAAIDFAFSELEEPESLIAISSQRDTPQRPVQKASSGNVSSRKKDRGGIDIQKAVMPQDLLPTMEEVSLRQKAILEVLKRRDKTTVGELGLLFSGKVSKKTLQRDLVDLVERKVIGRDGDHRWTTYFLV